MSPNRPVIWTEFTQPGGTGLPGFWGCGYGTLFWTLPALRGMPSNTRQTRDGGYPDRWTSVALQRVPGGLVVGTGGSGGWQQVVGGWVRGCFVGLAIGPLVWQSHSMAPKVDLAQLKADILSITPDEFVTRRIICATPYVFGTSVDKYAQWRFSLASQLELQGHSLIVVGSASIGASLNPAHFLRPFDNNSDIDVAVISAYHFDVAWRWLRTLGTALYRLPPNAQSWVRQHETRLVYYGSIATDRLLPYLPFGKPWVIAQNNIASHPNTEGREVNFRLYRDAESLQSYQLVGVKKARRRLSE